MAMTISLCWRAEKLQPVAVLLVTRIACEVVSFIFFVWRSRKLSSIEIAGKQGCGLDWGAPSASCVCVSPHQPCFLDHVACSRPAERALGTPKFSNELRLHGSEFALVEEGCAGKPRTTAREIKDFRREIIKWRIMSSEGKMCIHADAEVSWDNHTHISKSP